MGRFLSVHRIFMAVLVLLLLSAGAVAWGGWKVYRAARRALILEARRDAPWTEVRRETKTFDTGGARVLVIDNPMGDVHVMGTVLASAARRPSGDALPDDHHVRVENLVRRRDDVAPAPRSRRPLVLSGKAAGGGEYRVIVHGDPKDSIRADLVVRVPPRLAVEVITDVGDVQVHGVKGEVTLRGFAGETEVSGCPGPVSINRSAGEMQVKGTREAVEVHADAGSLTVSDATGPVHASTRAGEVILERVAGDDVKASVSTGQVTIGLRPGRVGSVVARARIGEADIAVPPEADCRVRIDVGLGSAEDQRASSRSSSANAGLVDVGVGIGQITVTDAES
jgi:hypothetical protein